MEAACKCWSCSDDEALSTSAAPPTTPASDASRPASRGGAALASGSTAAAGMPTQDATAVISSGLAASSSRCGSPTATAPLSSCAASPCNKARCAERTSSERRRHTSKRSSTASISCRWSAGVARHASDRPMRASTAAGEKCDGWALRSRWPRCSRPSERSISCWLRAWSRSALATSRSDVARSSAPRGRPRRRAATRGSSTLSMPPSESLALTVSTSEMRSERRRASHAPSAVCATHVPPASVSRGCQPAASPGSSKKGRPASARA
eukprot:scaffold66038_cov27-Tisochrysis_lutea.AAC.1